MKDADIARALVPIIRMFEKLDVAYYVSGSVASSAYGIVRTTLDIDIVADISSRHVDSLVRMIGSHYYIDRNMILDAIQRCSSFNVIHLETLVKVDIFIAKKGKYNQEVFRRRREDTLGEESEYTFYLLSPEDSILNKLDWYKKGGEVSERQWLDVLGVMKVQRNNLDIHYLQQWAPILGIENVLNKAFTESGISIS